MSKMVTISKPGQGKIRILEQALVEHLKLGWTEVEDEIAKVEAAPAAEAPAAESAVKPTKA